MKAEASYEIPKFRFPDVSHSIRREGFTATMDGLAAIPGIWVAAPAGSGKTTSVASHLQHRRPEHLIWYQVGFEDADLVLFFHHLALATQGHRKPGTPLPPLTLEYALGVDVYAANFFRALFAELGSSFALVFDDWHMLPDDHPLHGLAALMLQYIPSGGQVIFISRQIPPPPFASRLVKRQLDMIDWQALQFDLADYRMIVEHIGRKIDETTLRQISELSQGWISAFLLLSGVIAGKGALPTQYDLSHIDQALLFDYLAVEVLGQLDEEMRRFLLVTSLFPEMTVSMAAKLVGIETQACQAILEELRRSCMFAQRRGTDAHHYTYHALFRGFLSHRFAQAFGPDEQTALRRRAAGILEKAGFPGHAVELLEATGDWQEIDRICCQQADQLLAHGGQQTLMSWLGKIPANLRQQRPQLLYLTGECESCSDPIAAREKYETSLLMLIADGDFAMAYKVWTAATNSFYGNFIGYDGMPKWLDLYERLQAGHAEIDPALIHKVEMARWSLLFPWRPTDPAIAELEHRLRQYVLTDADVQEKIQMGMQLIMKNVFYGENLEARPILDLIGAIVESGNIPPQVEIMWHGMSALWHWPCGNLQEAKAHIAKAMAIADATGIHVFFNMIQGQGIYTHLAEGDLETAKQHIDNMEKNLHPAAIMEHANLYVSKAWWHLLQGQYDQACQFANLCIRTQQLPEPAFPPKTMAQLVILQSHIFRDEFGKAHDILREFRALSSAIKAHDLIYVITWLEAYIHLKQGDEDAAIPLLSEGINVMQAHGFVLFPCLHRDILSTLCAFAIERGIALEWVRAMIHQLHLSPGSGSQSKGAWDWPVRVGMFGSCTVTVNGAPAERGRKTARRPLELLKLIIVHDGKLREQTAIDALWPDADAEQALNALKANVGRLRNMIGKTAVLRKKGEISLNRSEVWSDYWAFQELSAGLQASGKRLNPSQLAHLLELYRGELLPEDELGNIAAARSRCRHTFLTLLSRHMEGLGQEQATEVSYQLLERCPDAKTLVSECLERISAVTP